jgi:hypothetical protein
MKKIIIAKDGFDATTETDPDNLIFSSDYNTFKYNDSGSDTFTIPTGSTSGEHVIATHNLGYIPFFQVFANDAPGFPTRFYALPFSFADAGVFDHRFVYATTTQIIFRYENTGFGIDVNLEFHYKIFKNDLLLS